ncbi:MAG TPA: hypothetical protein VHE78_01350, partial [Gemmatimonadaceae bacterium]|nr:hypothetical protein [Gemmatimonadaceae bacterium]
PDAALLRSGATAPAADPDGLAFAATRLRAGANDCGAGANGLAARADQLGARTNGLGAPSNGLAAPSNGLGAHRNGLGAPSNGLAAYRNGLRTPHARRDAYSKLERRGGPTPVLIRRVRGSQVSGPWLIALPMAASGKPATTLGSRSR